MTTETIPDLLRRAAASLRSNTPRLADGDRWYLYPMLGGGAMVAGAGGSVATCDTDEAARAICATDPAVALALADVLDFQAGYLRDQNPSIAALLGDPLARLARAILREEAAVQDHLDTPGEGSDWT